MIRCGDIGTFDTIFNMKYGVLISHIGSEQDSEEDVYYHMFILFLSKSKSNNWTLDSSFSKLYERLKQKI